VLAAIVVVPKVLAPPPPPVDQTEQRISILCSAIDHFNLDTGHFPSRKDGFQALLVKPEGVVNWHGPYLEKVPKDQWGRDFVYQVPGNNGRTGYVVYSYGKDGVPGGTGADSDHSNGLDY